MVSKKWQMPSAQQWEQALTHLMSKMDKDGNCPMLSVDLNELCFWLDGIGRPTIEPLEAHMAWCWRNGVLPLPKVATACTVAVRLATGHPSQTIVNADIQRLFGNNQGIIFSTCGRGFYDPETSLEWSVGSPESLNWNDTQFEIQAMNELETMLDYSEHWALAQADESTWF